MPSWHLIFSARIPAIDKGCLIHNIHVLLICSIKMAINMILRLVFEPHPPISTIWNLTRIIIAGLENHTSFDAAMKCWLIPVFRPPIVSGSTWIHLHCRIYIYHHLPTSSECARLQFVVLIEDNLRFVVQLRMFILQLPEMSAPPRFILVVKMLASMGHPWSCHIASIPWGYLCVNPLYIHY